MNDIQKKNGTTGKLLPNPAKRHPAASFASHSPRRAR
jgi:hypothetical protein